MAVSNHIPLTASELGNLWMTYQDKTMLMRVLEHLLEHVEEQEIQQLLQSSYDFSKQAVETISTIFEEEGAVVPIGFTENDVYKNKPKLFGNLYDLMFLQMIDKIGISLFALYSTMSFRKDIRNFFMQLTDNAQEELDQATQILLEKGVLVRSPAVSMPKEVTFVQDKDYLSGFNILNKTRSLNTIEVSLIYHAIETNLVGLQLMIGFAQVAKDKQVKDYFVKGMNLSMKIETTLGEFLRQDFIEPPATPNGKATDSTVAPFSDKLMMYITNLLSTFGLGSNALGGAFSLRSDLPMTMARIALDIFSFAKKGGEIMIKNGWMEEPPQIEDRRKLTSS
ncbi:DUF3231 family protein [Neobacillus novalis]|uniref:DUF3231 family protein n=1 Tax=Neobacillus novalis TaxID=220687 RepID=A0AA95S9T5_9BACI|nr:DUF3231 family protein [Neobacillus novalis]WHY84629.1 DUF3231 family protein [Neobacillus novalis]